DHVPPQGGRRQHGQAKADGGQDDAGGPLAGGDERLAGHPGQRSPGPDVLQPPTGGGGSHGDPRAAAGGHGEGRRVRGIGDAVEGGVEEEPDLGRAPRLHGHCPVEGVEQPRDGDRQAGGGRPDPAVDRSQRHGHNRHDQGGHGDHVGRDAGPHERPGHGCRRLQPAADEAPGRLGEVQGGPVADVLVAIHPAPVHLI
ncbi:MAG: hypothetical protein AVDCRST_MAG10-191, partial [uncultured Acidimicrobiales bacterium]